MIYSTTSPSDQDMLTELRILGSIVENDRIATNPQNVMKSNTIKSNKSDKSIHIK